MRTRRNSSQVIELRDTTTTDDVRRAIRDATRRHPARLVLLAEDVSALDDATLSVLLAGAARADARGTAAYLVDPPAAIRAVLAGGVRLVVVGETRAAVSADRGKSPCHPRTALR